MEYLKYKDYWKKLSLRSKEKREKRKIKNFGL